MQLTNEFYVICNSNSLRVKRQLVVRGQSVTLGSFIGKGLGNHLIKGTFVDPYIFTARALDFVTMHLRVIDLIDAVFMTAKHLTGANLVISPQFLFAGSAVDSQHGGCCDV